jgi:hypothetical protein
MRERLGPEDHPPRPATCATGKSARRRLEKLDAKTVRLAMSSPDVVRGMGIARMKPLYSRQQALHQKTGRNRCNFKGTSQYLPNTKRLSLYVFLVGCYFVNTIARSMHNLQGRFGDGVTDPPGPQGFQRNISPGCHSTLLQFSMLISQWMMCVINAPN